MLNTVAKHYEFTSISTFCDTFTWVFTFDIICDFILIFVYISEENTVLFSPLHLFDGHY